MGSHIKLLLQNIFYLFLLSFSARSQETGIIDTLIYFNIQKIDTSGIAVTGDIDSLAVYFAVDNTFRDYNLLEIQLLLSPYIYRNGDSTFSSSLNIHTNGFSKRPGSVLTTTHFVGNGFKDVLPYWLRIDLRDSTKSKALNDDFWIVGADLLSSVVSMTNSGHTFLHSLNLQKWDSVKFDFAVKAIIEQNKPTAVRDNKVLPNNPVYFIQNFPNPFNQETVIKLKIPKLAAVSLNIFDISGKLIRRIAQNELIDGEGLFPWDGKDADGFLVSSGIYFYIAKVGNDEVMTNKMLIIK